MANIYTYWLVNQEGNVKDFNVDKCTEIMKTFGFTPFSMDAEGNQIQVAVKAFTLPKKVIRALANTFFNNNEEVKVYAEDDVQDYYRYYKIRTK